MKSFLKYLLIILITSSMTIVALMQIAPFIILVPNKDTQEIQINFDQTLAKKELKKIDKKAKNIILLIGDGMGINQVTAYRIAKGGPNYISAFDKFPFTGLVKTHAVDTLITDSASAATAYSSGIKTVNGYLGVNKDKKIVKNITEMLHEKGYITSLIATSEITHATPAAFTVHNESRDNTDQIAEAMFRSNNFISLGGGRDFFVPEDLGGQREDNFDILSLIKEQESYLESKNDFINFQLDTSKRIFGLFAKEGFIREDNEPDLLEMFNFTLEQSKKVLVNNCAGFFIMTEGSQIDWEGHENNFNGQFKEMDEFDQVVNRALEYAKTDQNTLVIVLSDHETGGLLIETDDWNRNPEPSNKMKISWNTAVGLGTHTGTMIPAFAYGPGASNVTGVIDNTDIFFIMKEALGLDELSDRKCLN